MSREPRAADRFFQTVPSAIDGRTLVVGAFVGLLGVVTPAASATSFIEASWNPRDANTDSATSRIWSLRSRAGSRVDIMRSHRTRRRGISAR